MGTRSMSDKIQEKETSHEKEFVTRAERDALKRMLAKMDADADPGHKKSLADLEKRLTPHGVKLTEEMKKAMLEWKTGH